MSELFNEGDFVKIQHDVGSTTCRDTFGCLISSLSSFDHSEPEQLIVFNTVDPLTSFGFGAGGIRRGSIQKIERIELPYLSTFDFDSVQEFGKHLTADPLFNELSYEFFFTLIDFCLRHDLLRVSETKFSRPVDDSFRLQNTDFNPLGLDFCRQHYRDLKKTLLGNNEVLRDDLLQTRLNETIANRTTDLDWQYKSVV